MQVTPLDNTVHWMMHSNLCAPSPLQGGRQPSTVERAAPSRGEGLSLLVGYCSPLPTPTAHFPLLAMSAWEEGWGGFVINSDTYFVTSSETISDHF